MKAHLVCGDTILQMPSARIARDDVDTLLSSTELLEQAKTLKDSAELAAEEAERAGYERGKELALSEMREVLAEALSSLTKSFEEENTRRERGTAAAAMQVVEKLIGRMDDAAVISGLAREALKQAGAGEVTVQVSPEWAETVRARLAADPDLTVEADPALEQFGCRIASRDGRIIADLDTQLASLRARWGLEEPEQNG